MRRRAHAAGVVAYLPNIPEAMVAFLATVSIGGVWSLCAPDMGSHAVLDRFQQIGSKVLIACAVEAWNEQGQPVLDEVGELVCTQPIPSMPSYFLGDAGNQRYLASYFDTYPGVWRHGDWLKIGANGGCIIYAWRGRDSELRRSHGDGII